MKRLFTGVKYKRLMQIRQDRALRRAKSKGPSNVVAMNSHLPLLRIAAPEHFSLVNNPEEAIRFLSNLHCSKSDRKFFVDLAKSNFISCDAVAVLVATIESEFCIPSVFGNWPEDEQARQLIFDSGFSDRIRSHGKEKQKALGTISKKDVYLNKIDKTVSTDLARDLVEFARGHSKRSHQETPSYGVLIDLMDNTVMHASKGSGAQVSWWATVYWDSNRNRECYCFVDLGVGIFRSTSFRQRIKYLPNEMLGSGELKMQALLEGRVPSVTGLPYRGKGLPWIYESGLAGRIQSLVIIANDVYARPTMKEYRLLQKEFHGTFIYWET